MKKINKKIIGLTLALGLITSTMTGCGVIRPYDTPEFVEIAPNETAFVIPLEGKTSEQGKFDSEKYLQEMQVATKRIQVPHKWVKMGKMRGNGEWVDTVRVITVDRSPVNREWFNDASRSTSGKSQGFTGESKDSIKFLIGLTATAKILEPDTAKFLYQYSGKSLAQVMDTEIRNKIGTVLLETYGNMTMDEIRKSKDGVIDTVREETIPYFEKFGITLSNVGYVGDLEYVDPAVQTAINEAFNAEQAQKAQTIKNETEIKKAQAEKEASQLRAEAMKEIIEMRELELQEQWIQKWSGDLPSYIGGDNGNIVNIPKFN